MQSGVWCGVDSDFAWWSTARSLSEIRLDERPPVVGSEEMALTYWESVDRVTFSRFRDSPATATVQQTQIQHEPLNCDWSSHTRNIQSYARSWRPMNSEYAASDGSNLHRVSAIDLVAAKIRACSRHREAGWGDQSGGSVPQLQ